MTNEQLSHPPGSHALLRTIWPELCLDGSNSQKHYSHLLEFFDHELNIVRKNVDFFATQSVHSIRTLIQEMKTLDVITRRQILSIAREKISGPHVADDKLLRLIDIAIGLWLTINISSSGFGRDNVLLWGSEQTLQDLIHSHFKDKKRTKYPRTENWIDPQLTAEFLSSNFGYTITWTNSLADHLEIDWKYKVITIYEHKICLYNHIRFPGSSIVPQDIIEEAIDTMNLLFPFQDDATKRFLTKERKRFYGLGYCNRPRKLELEEYQYWRHRIADLGYILQGPAVGLQQLRVDKDGKNLLQIAGFWIATAVGVFTVVSIAVGEAAIVYGVKQYDLAKKQYQLTLVELCLNPTIKAQIQDLCA